jgi:DnaJ-class molecular chaperone
MADDRTADTPEQKAPVPCAPCRGTGRIVSRLGGSASTVTCPWCEGTGTVIPGHDAQARHKGPQDGGDDGPAAA